MLRIIGDDGKRTRFGDVGERKLRSLARGLGLSEAHEERARRTFRLLTQSFHGLPIGSMPRWRSGITDDHSPFELSVALTGEHVDLRMLVEAWDPRMEHHRGWEPAIALNESLRGEEGVDLTRFEALKDIFQPDERVKPGFSLWHAAVVGEEGPPVYKLYFNPQVLGSALAPGLIREALERIGLTDAWSSVQELLAVSAGSNEILYVALDLTEGPQTRVKVYVGHYGVHAAALEHQLSQFSSYEPGYATWLVRQLAGNEGPFHERPVLTCLGFTERPDAPEVTLHFPARCYVRDDAQLAARLRELVPGDRGNQLMGAVEDYAERDLAIGRGLMTYVSLRRATESSGPRVVVYLSPETYQVAPPQQLKSEVVLSAPPESPMLQLLAHVEHRKEGLKAHPFIQLLESSNDRNDVRAFSDGLSFFVLAFQDILRLAADRVEDPLLRRIAQDHHREDAGHDLWFLQDAEQLGLDVSARRLFSSEHCVAREVGYELVADVLRSDSDASKLAVVFALEAVGEVFFERVISILERTNSVRGMKYFGRHHQNVEQNHAMFEAEVRARLLPVPLREGELESAVATVDRVYEQMQRLAGDLVRRVEQDRRVAASL